MKTAVQLESISDDVPVECRCACHNGENEGIHFRSCCEGQCSKCRKWFASGLKSHIAVCDTLHLTKAPFSSGSKA
jgi:hypothetical protein